MPRPRERKRTDFGHRLHQARTQAKLSQTALAKAVGISQGTLGELEVIGVGSAYTPQLARVCGVSSEWLASGEGAMHERPGLSTEVADLAAQLDALTGLHREWALSMCRQAVRAVHGEVEPPTSQADTDQPERNRKV